jgi:hypothetical protein
MLLCPVADSRAGSSDPPEIYRKWDKVVVLYGELIAVSDVNYLPFVVELN